jgi:sugar-specific transcriptional regulator TrmB
MPRKPNIPFGDKRKQELARVNAAINRKQKNLEKRFDGMRADFEKKSASDFKSVKEYNEYINAARNFTKRTANKFDLVNPENGKHVGFNVLRKIEQEIKRVNKIKEREFAKIKDRPHRETGRKTGLTIGENMDKKIGFSDPKFEHFKKIHFDPKHYEGTKDAQLDLKKLKDRYEGDFIRNREWQHYYNYVESLHTVFNESSHPMKVLLSDDIQEIIDQVVSLGIDEFTRRYYDGTLPTIKFIYGKDARDTKMAELTAAFLEEE